MLRPPPPRDASDNPIKTPYEGSSKYDAEPERYDAQGRKLAEPVYRPSPPPGHPTQLFKPWTTPAERVEQWAKEGNGGEDPFKDYVPATVREKLPVRRADASDDLRIP